MAWSSWHKPQEYCQQDGRLRGSLLRLMSLLAAGGFQLRSVGLLGSRGSRLESVLGRRAAMSGMKNIINLKIA